MSANQKIKAFVYSQNAAKARTATSNKTMMTTISISKDSHSIPMMEIAPAHETQWNKIQSFYHLSDNLHGQLGSDSVTDLVITMSNSVPT